MLDIIKLVAALAVISAVAGLAIGYTNEKTADKIAAQQQQIRQAAISSVFPAGADIKEMKDKGNEIVPPLYWTAFQNDTLIGYAFEVAGRGYAGDIKYMLGVDKEGKITGVTVLDHNETPGLGSRVNEVASAKYIWNPLAKVEKIKPWFTEQFEGLSSLKPIEIDKSSEWHKLDEQARAALKDKNAVTAITGSTISTAAFTKSIELMVSAYINELGGYCCPASRAAAESAVAEEEVEVDVIK